MFLPLSAQPIHPMEFSLNPAFTPSALTAIPANTCPANPTVYGVVLNHPCALEGLGEQLAQPPYQAPPKGPVLYIKPRNTWAESGSEITLPEGETAVELGATLALVMGTAASRLSADTTLAAVAACQLAVDASLPHSSYYRPAIREKCFDGSCVLGALQAPLPALENLVIQTLVNGQQVDSWRVDELIRSPAQLLADVTAFMTLNPGDRLLIGIKWCAPQARPGDAITVQANGLPAVQFSVAQTTQTHAHNNGEPA